MNWKYLIGKTASRIEDFALKSNSGFIYKNYPFGRNWLFDVSRRYVKNPKHIVDAGANVGDVSIELSNLYKQAYIYSFEPIKSTFENLINSTRNNLNIKAENLALSDKEEELTIYLNGEHTINSLSATKNWTGSVGEQKISCITLDSYCEEKGINSIDILKIDVEGHELKLLDGAINLLRNNSIKLIYLEVGFDRGPNKVHFSEVDTFMECHNFKLCGIYELTRNYFDKGRLWFGNFLYVHSSMFENAAGKQNT